MFSLIRIVIEVVQVYYLHLLHFFELENWLEGFLFVSSIIFVSYGLQSGCQCPGSWQWQFGAIILLAAWLNLVLFLKKFPLTGVYVLMFVDILYTFMKMAVLTALFVVSFGLTFYMIFYRPVSSHIVFVVLVLNIIKSCWNGGISSTLFPARHLGKMSVEMLVFGFS